MIAVFFISLIALLFLSVPVAFALGLSSVFGILLHPSLDLSVVPQRVLIAVNSFPLMAIPFFILAGGLMQSSGIARRLVNFAMSLVGHLTGGLAVVAIITAMFFAAISGSGTATVITIGTILIPIMIAKGYPKGFTSSTLAASGALGIIIPPSIPLILYGISAQVSVSDMFLAGIFPGFIITASLIILSYFFSKKNKLPRSERSSFKEIVRAFVEAIPALIMPVIVLGGIYSGIFTPTEASVIAVVYALIAGIIYRELSISNIIKTLVDSSVTTAIIMIIIATSGLFSFFIQINYIPDLIADLLSTVTGNPYVFMIVINLILLVVGMFMEGSAAILILTPLFLPLALTAGIDPVHFGIVMVVNLAIGLITPPVGLNLFASAQISGISIKDITVSIIPFVIVMFIATLLISFMPVFSIWFKFF
ncbi:TRAP transporter large permease [Psychrobacillus soli]|uniref:TRAP transporter large permease n=1 Tax=Psychrobacillus soli TaxID=1543965 RepID=A0A544TMT2_9BACI|nr:TRAP transporter large permease [Psychrobacillus soli]TQR18772.1 TRAP transporter large permease [Psychrobacillus soli]